MRLFAANLVSASPAWGLLFLLLGSLAAEEPEKIWNDSGQLPLNLLGSFNNDGISFPPQLSNGNFDCPDHPEGVPGSTFPGELLPEPGSVIRLGENPQVHFLFPSREPGEFNNLACNGQYLDIEDGYFEAAYLLGASENGHFPGYFNLYYQEGPESTNAGLSDWCSRPVFDESPGFEFSYRYAWQAAPTQVARENVPCRLWVQKIELNPKWKLQGLSLPFQRRMHLFAMTLLSARPQASLAERAEETAKLYAALKTRKVVYADGVREALRSVRKEISLAIDGLPFQREAHWLEAVLEYADWRLPERNEHVGTDLERLARQAMADARRDLQELRHGRNPFLARRGQLLKNYYSALDNSWQTYAVSVPDDYKGDKPYPLIVQLHGHDWYRPFQGFPSPNVSGVIHASPQGRGSIDYMLGAEEDVLRVIQEVQRDYWIDPDRVILEGHSMGGTGAWNIGVKFPDQFCCIAPVAGNTDHTAWISERPPKRQPDGAFQGLMNFIQDATDPITYAGNLGHLPEFCVHGALDDVVSVEHARRMTRRVAELGFNPIYREFEQVGHWGFPGSVYDERWKWMLAQVREPRPATVRFKTARLRYPGAYWIRIEQFEEWGRFAEVMAEQVDQHTVQIQASNVDGLSVLPHGLPRPPRGRLAVWIDRQKAFDGDPGEAVRLEMTGGTWRPAKAAAGLVKRKDLEGPVGDALLGPFLIVYGTTSGDAFWNWMTRSEAESLADDWQLLFRVRPRLKPDTDVTLKDIEQFHLLLYGGPEQNAISRRVCPTLPIRISLEGIQVGDREFRGRGLGLKMCYPNPLNPARYVVLAAALEPWGLWQINNRFGNWIGWGPYDNWNWFDYAVFDDLTSSPDTIVCAGFFGPRWDIVEETMWLGSAVMRGNSRPRCLPGVRDVSEMQPVPDTLFLSDLLPSRIRQHKGVVNLNRSYEGDVLRIGTAPRESGFGVRAPSEFEFVLNKKFARLKTEYGIDLEGADKVTGKRGRVEWIQFRVLGDGKRLWSSEWIQWNAKTNPVEVDIKGIEVLKLEVDGGGERWHFGSAAWGNTRVE